MGRARHRREVAGKHPFLTNMAQGGRAIPGRLAIEAAFGARAGEVTNASMTWPSRRQGGRP